MGDTGLKTASTRRLSELNEGGCRIMFMDMDHASHDECRAMLDPVVKELESYPDNGARLLVNAAGLDYEPGVLNHWKTKLEVFSAKVGRVAVYNVSPLIRMAVMGMRAYARLIGAHHPDRQAQFFSTRDEAVRFLSEPL